MEILLVEDHRDIAENIADYCEARGDELVLAMDGRSALRMLERQQFDVIVLDVMLPRMDGLTCLRSMREQGNATPVLLLTARDTLEDKLAGFAAGADDYLIKPFALPELFVRIQALSRRAKAPAMSEQQRRWEIGDLIIDVDQHTVVRAGRSLHVNKTCFGILVLLAEASPSPVSRQVIEDRIWGSKGENQETLRTHMYHLRQIIDRPFAVPLIETVRGVGVRLVNPDAPA